MEAPKYIDVFKARNAARLALTEAENKVKVQ